MCRATATSLPVGAQDVAAQTFLGGEADGVEDAVEATPARREVGGGGFEVGGIGDVDLDHVDRGLELARRALGQRQPPPRSREHQLGPFGLGPAGHAEGQRRVGEHARDEDPLPRQEAVDR